MTNAAAPGGDDARRLSRRRTYDALVAAHKGKPSEGVVETFAAESGFRPEDAYWDAAAPFLLTVDLTNAAAERLKTQIDRIGRKELPDDHTAFSHALLALPEEFRGDLSRYQNSLGPAVDLDDPAWHTLGAMMIGVRALAKTSNDIRKADVEMRAEITMAKAGIAKAQELNTLLRYDIEVGESYSRALKDTKMVDRSFTIVAILTMAALLLGEWYFIAHKDQTTMQLTACAEDGALMSSAANARDSHSLGFAMHLAKQHGCSIRKG